MRARGSIVTDLAGVLSIGAGLVHAAAAGTHAGDDTVVWLFAVTAIVQCGFGAVLLAGASRRTLIGAGAANLSAVGAWALSRTVGLPVIDSAAGPQVVATQDLIAALLAAGSVALVVFALRPVSMPERASRLAWLPALAVLPAVLGVAAPHAQGRQGAETAAHALAEPSSEEAAALAADPVLSGADTTDATEAQLQAAIALVEDTRAAIAAQYTDVASVEAAGYAWIGDGRRAGGYQHYVNAAYMTDGRDLDPERVESLVFRNTTEGPQLVTSMYILEPGTTIDDVPDVAGDVTVWHDHQNLCWDDAGARLAGVVVDGTCRPGGTFRPTPPMLHVWLVDNECGPFTGVENHGSAGCASHAS